MNDCDFIPAEYHGQQTLRRSIKLRASCAVGLLLIMGAWFAAHQGQIATAEAMLTEAGLQKDQVRVHAEKQRQMSAERARLDARRRLLEELSDQASLVLVLGDVSRRLPPRVVLTGLTFNCPSVSEFVMEADATQNMAPEGRRQSVIAGAELEMRTGLMLARIEMSGIAVSLSDMIHFASAMEESALVRRVDMKVKEPTTWGGRRAEQFTLTCELVPQEGSEP